MKYLQHMQQVLRFKFCTIFYMICAVITFCDQMFWKQGVISILCNFVLYTVLYYKGIKILRRYIRAEKRGYPVIEQSEFHKKYRWFRIQVVLWWIGFTVLCGVAKYIWNIDSRYYLSLSFFLLGLDLIFVNTVCLLQLFSDPKAKVVVCCCGCPVRGWDLLMINTPLFFAFQIGHMYENVFTMVAIIFGVISLIYWEKGKYSLVEVRKKCKKSCELKLCAENRQ